MKHYSKLAMFSMMLSFFFACQPKEKKQNDKEEAYPTRYAYSVEVDYLSEKNAAPDLQSFAHAVNGSDWLLFAGRTNSKGSRNGGMHNFGNNYARQSFAPLSFNQQLFVYNVDNNSLDSLHLNNLLERIASLILQEDGGEIDTEELINPFSLLNWKSAFRNTNPLIAQDGETLYLLGGYGYANEKDTLSKYYKTFDHVMKLHVPTMIKVIKNEKITLEEFYSLMRFKFNSGLVSTGGEMHMVNDVLYMSGGHDYYHTITPDTTITVKVVDKQGDTIKKNVDTTLVNSIQNYVDAVYPFTVSDADFPFLKVSVQPFISDVSDPSTIAADAISKFRRRDGPILPALFQNPTTKAIEEGITFYAGVFTPSGGVWNDAIYVHPSFESTGNKYTYDSLYNQNNQSVYSCPDFELFDSSDSTVHTFLLGGIGNDTTDANAQQGFTNAGVHITMDITTNPLSSSAPAVMNNVFGNNLTAPYFGAEAAMFLSNDLTHYTTTSGNETEVIDLNSLSWSSDKADIGYVYGGIHADKMNNASYGSGGSKASNRVWTVSLTRKVITE